MTQVVWDHNLCPTRTSSRSADILSLELILNYHRLIDDCGEDITNYGVRGELCIRGPTVVRGYFDNDKANAESFDHEGFFKTGDILYCDEASKKWYIVDRKKVL